MTAARFEKTFKKLVDHFGEKMQILGRAQTYHVNLWWVNNFRLLRKCYLESVKFKMILIQGNILNLHSASTMNNWNHSQEGTE